MPVWDAASYGDRIADVYDDWYGDTPEVVLAVSVLAELARGRRVLELGVGTGRLALPLVAKGLDVHGIDVSEAMVARLRAKPGGNRVTVTIGDFAGVEVAGPFGLVVCAFNTFFNLDEATAQERCLHRVATLLEPDGLFVVEAFVPGPAGDDRAVEVRRVSAGEVVLGATRHDPSTQRVETQTVLLGPAGPRLFPSRLRYASPGELDLMARLAGLHLRERWSGWDRAPFDSSASSHVSVYGR